MRPSLNPLLLVILTELPGIALAQSSVTFYGSYDNGLRNLTHADAAGDSRLSTGSVGLYNSNRWGLTGSEDLGGGLKAVFTLESAFDGGTGAGSAGGVLFGRDATVGLAGDWGKVLAGRQFSVNARTVSSFDPFSFRYLSITPLSKDIVGTSSDRFDDDVQYTGSFGNLLTRAEYKPGGVAGSAKTGTAVAAGATYAIGGAKFGAAYTQWDDAAGAGLNRRQLAAGAEYRAGDLRVTSGYIDDRVDGTTGDKHTEDVWIGTVYSISVAWVLTGAMYRTDASAAGVKGSKTLWMAGLTYALSKRTNFYAEVDNTRFTGSYIQNSQGNQTGIAVGINQWF
jgi:predicted porin